MNDHDGTPIPVEEGVPVGGIPHDLAGLVDHERFVLAIAQRIVDSGANILRMSKLHLALDDSVVRQDRQSIFSRPRIDGLEERSMRRQNVLVGQLFYFLKLTEGLLKSRHEGYVLNSPDDVRIFFVDKVPQVTSRHEVAKRIKCHGCASRR